MEVIKRITGYSRACRPGELNFNSKALEAKIEVK